MTSAVRLPAIGVSGAPRGAGTRNPATLDAAAKAIHPSVTAKNTIMTPCSTVMLAKLDDAEHLVHAVTRQSERAKNRNELRAKIVRGGRRFHGRRIRSAPQILHRHVERPLERHAAAEDVLCAVHAIFKRSDAARLQAVYCRYQLAVHR